MKEMNVDTICNSCKRKGHWKKCCKTKTVSEIQSNLDDKEFFFGEIHIDQLDSVNQSPWKADFLFVMQLKGFSPKHSSLLEGLMGVKSTT